MMIGKANYQAGNNWSKWYLRHYFRDGTLAKWHTWQQDDAPLHEFAATRQDPGGRIWVAGTYGRYGLVQRLAKLGETVYEEVGSGLDQYEVEFKGLHFDRYQNLYLSSIWQEPDGFESRGIGSSNLEWISPFKTFLTSGQQKTATVRLKWAAPNNSFRRVTLIKENAGDPLTLPAYATPRPGALGVAFTMTAGTVAARKEVRFKAVYGGESVNAIAVIDP